MNETPKKTNGSLILANAVRITSRQNPTVAEAAGLGDKKRRDERGLFLLDGIKLTLEAAVSPLTIEYVLLTERASEKFSEQLSLIDPDVHVCILSDSAFDRVTDERAPEGVVTAVRYSESVRRRYESADADDPGCRLILDGVQNPENFGAILRSARAFGISGVICGAGCADIYGRRVMRASMGAALHVGTLYTEDVSSVCRELTEHGHRVIAAMPRADSAALGEFAFVRGDCIVIGNEGHGISDEVSAESTACVSIPMAEGQESLNAACAASVMLWEMYRNIR